MGSNRLAPPSTTLVLISLDGFRWDYHAKAPAPHLRRLMARGVTAERLIPVYPTKTFPNHYSIVTGLYPARHGIVSNNIREPETNRRFTMADREAMGDPRWWRGEPLWVTAERQGRRTATLFWPGSEAPIDGVRPDEWTPYDESVPNHERVVRILRWLALPRGRRPAFITGYFSDVDDAGHEAGPESAAVREAIASVDGLVGAIADGIAAMGLADEVSLVVVSDHGMTTISSDRLIPLGEYLDLSTVDVVDLDVHLGLNPREGSADELHRRLAHAHPHLRVYRRHETPAAWRYREQARIPAIVGVADEGWMMVRSGSRLATGPRRVRGNHGFDPGLRSMHGLFVAAGPAFRRGVTVPPFENVHIYNALAAAIGVTPALNDGSPAIAQQLLTSAW